MAAKNPCALLRTVRSFSKLSYTGVAIEEVINKSVSETGKKSEIRIWWDGPTCEVPQNCHAGMILMNITKVLRQNQFSGPIDVLALLDPTPSRITRELCTFAAMVRTLPLGWDNGVLTEIMHLSMQKPPPLCHIVVSGNPKIENALAQLQVRGYDVLLLQPGKASPPPAEALWRWRSPNE